MLIKCHECQKEISTDAKNCPQCGAKNPYHVSKKIKIGCVAVILLFVLFGIIGKHSSESKWYAGGTLHKAGALEWQKASYSNKLATCADFIGKLHQDGLISLKINSIEDVRPSAEKLVKALDEAFKADSNPEKNRKLYANQTVAGTVSILYIEWLKQ